MQGKHWKLLISLLAAFAALTICVEMAHGIPALARGTQGSLGYSGHDGYANGGHRRVIDSLVPGSQLALAGAVAGDVLAFDDNTARKTVRTPGDIVGVTLFHGAAPSHLMITATETPFTSSDITGYVLVWAAMWLGLALGLLTGLRKPDGKCYRLLSIYLVLGTLANYVNFTPPGALRMMLWLPWMLLFWALGPLLPLFALRYPDDQPRGVRGLLFRQRWLLYALAAVATALMVAKHTDLYESAWTGRVFTTNRLVEGLVLLAALAAGWWENKGPLRVRFGWLLLVLSVGYLADIFVQWPPFELQIGSFTSSWNIVNGLVWSVVFSMLTYAVLRHRIFDFGVAINRTLVYSVTSLLLLITFGLVEWLVGHVVHVDGREKNVLLDGAIALGVYLAFHRLRHGVEHWIERLFFQAWHQAENALRQFVREAAHVRSRRALIEQTTLALERFSGTQARLYRLKAESFVSAGGLAIDVNDPLATALAESRKPLLVAETLSTQPGELAVGLLHRGELRGFVLLDAKPGGVAYRADELDVLDYAVHQIGLDLAALDNEALKSNLARAEAEADAMRVRCNTLMEVMRMLGARVAPDGVPAVSADAHN
ncbi:hypothetical protein [Duganella violaceipulchra]|uniref:Histidine kinase n=1 Tax=Duganella violaceipulchra TaxID=2849652 RepID=A0AA41L1X3_9BURK|nr:hypothetical protein [Duganella violaceicalia]MBV6321508.1 hypothetical protein [Duganella violaceicalia]MCP2008235.1 hypothetical protein [Duganella violaceicalia]